MSSEDLSRVFGYYLCSPFDDEDADDHLEEFRLRAWRSGKEFVRCGYDDASAKATPGHERPGFRKLLEDVRSGDDVVVRQIIALGGDIEGVVSTIEVLAQWGINLNILNRRFGVFSITPPIASMCVVLLPAIAEHFKQSHREATKDGMAWRRKCRFVTNPFAGYGKKFVTGIEEVKNSKGKPARIEVWDFRECDQIREIRLRRLAGETYASIARDFFRRKERRSNGDLWANYRGRGKKRHIHIHRIRSADRYYAALRDNGQDLEGLPIEPLFPLAARVE